MDNKEKMPIIFVGHGSPLNAIEDNEYTRKWEEVGKSIPKPKAILAISAHWFTSGTRVSDIENPKIVYDMYGFPRELYQVKYPVKGDPHLARLAQDLISSEVSIDNEWGIDHGTWSVLVKMYPNADIPVVQLSVNRYASPEEHFKIGQELASLREQGILIFASGNVVHNLSMVDWEMQGGYDWAEDFDSYIKESIANGKFTNVINYKTSEKKWNEAIPTPEHFNPLLYALGASNASDKVTIFNNSSVMGSLSMTSYLFS